MSDRDTTAGQKPREVLAQRYQQLGGPEFLVWDCPKCLTRNRLVEEHFAHGTLPVCYNCATLVTLREGA